MLDQKREERNRIETCEYAAWSGSTLACCTLVCQARSHTHLRTLEMMILLIHKSNACINLLNKQAKKSFVPTREKSIHTAAAARRDNHDPGLVVSTVALPRTATNLTTTGTTEAAGAAPLSPPPPPACVAFICPIKFHTPIG
ncbi:conserved hypothetical protein [Trichinella spiralis]|uniref:hypothetical protein n=1 Tax=Trichinella spiralis TaxID=6334 RepID=UPI0001EFC75E|nr:conserved hypothetical protein [Trichinella spiralis]